MDNKLLYDFLVKCLNDAKNGNPVNIYGFEGDGDMEDVIRYAYHEKLVVAIPIVEGSKAKRITSVTPKGLELMDNLKQEIEY